MSERKKILHVRNKFQGDLIKINFISSNYIQDGLIAMWDGVENSTVPTHSSSTSTWRNLSTFGSLYDATSPSEIEFTDNGAIFNGTKCFSTPYNFMSDQMKGEWTVEVVFTPYSGSFSNYHGVCGEHAVDANTNGLIGCQYGNSAFAVGVYRQGTNAGDKAMCQIPQSAFPRNEISTFSITASATQMKFNVYIKGSDASLKGAYYSKIPSTISDLTLTGTQPFNIGSAFTNNLTDRLFIGVVHCCRVYSKSLSESEIQHNYLSDKYRFSISE